MGGVELPAQHHPTRWTGTAEPRPASCPSSSFESLSLAPPTKKLRLQRKSQLLLLSLSVRPPLRSRRSFLALIQHQPPWLFTSHLVSTLFSVVWSAGTVSLLTCKSITPQLDFVRLPVASEPLKPFSHTPGAPLPLFPLTLQVRLLSVFLASFSLLNMPRTLLSQGLCTCCPRGCGLIYLPPSLLWLGCHL